MGEGWAVTWALLRSLPQMHWLTQGSPCLSRAAEEGQRGLQGLLDPGNQSQIVMVVAGMPRRQHMGETEATNSKSSGSRCVGPPR